MRHSNKILVIDDNSSRSRNLNVLFDFLSETSVITTSVDWLDGIEAANAQKDEFFAVFLGALLKAETPTRRW